VAPLIGETEMKALMLNKSFEFITLENYCLPNIQKEIFILLRKSLEWYPDILNWYFNIFIPEFIDGTRNILICHIDNKVAGIALLKNDFNEKKICTFRVKYDYRSNGIGKTLFKKCLETLDTDKPVFTVPAERLCYFSNILKYYNFRLEQVLEGYYQQNSCEFVFNGYLDSKKISYNTSSKESFEDKYMNFNRFLLSCSL